MSEEQQPTEIWTPPEQLTTNVMKMAWALLMTEVKGYCEKGSIADYPVDRFVDTYRHCIEIAKALEGINSGG